jgi:hypothetical protein
MEKDLTIMMLRSKSALFGLQGSLEKEEERERRNVKTKGVWFLRMENVRVAPL